MPAFSIFVLPLKAKSQQNVWIYDVDADAVWEEDDKEENESKKQKDV